MHRCLKKAKQSLAIALISAAVSSLSLSFIPFTSGIEEAKSNTAAYAIAAAFWIGLLLMLIATFVTQRALSGVLDKMVSKKKMKRQKLPGIICFSFGGKRLMLYAVAAVGLILSITDIAYNYIPERVMFPIISVTILSFIIHCVVDGKYYKVYKLIKESVNDEKDH